MKLISESIDTILFIVTGWPIVISLIKTSLIDGYQYPFTGLLLAGAPLALIGLVNVFRKLSAYNGSGTAMNLHVWEYIILGGCYGISQIFAIIALSYSHLSLLRYAIFVGAAEAIAMPLFSYFILKRLLHGHYALVVLLSVAAMCISEFVSLDRVVSTSNSSSNNPLIISTALGWEGPFFAFFSRIIGIFGTVSSKKYILNAAFKAKELLVYSEDVPIGASNWVGPGKEAANNATGEESVGEVDDFGEKLMKGESALTSLLSKDSMVFRRFELIKKLDFNYDDLRFEQGSQRDPYLENKFAELRKLLGENTVKVHQLRELPKYKSRPKFEYYLNYGALNERELDDVFNVEDQQQQNNGKTRVDYARRKDGRINEKDMKKWEVQNMLKLESRERGYLEELVEDYVESNRNAHLFSGQDDLLLTKYDSIFDSMVHDADHFCAEMSLTFELYSILNLSMCVIALFAAFMNAEYYTMMHQFNEVQTSKTKQASFFDSGRLMYYFIVGVVMFIKPFGIKRTVVNRTNRVYSIMRFVNDAIVILFASTFTNSTPYVSTNVAVAFFITGIAHYANFAGISHKTDWVEFASIVELVKTHFANSLETDQLILLELRLIQIHQLLGRSEFFRISLDLVSSKNPRQLLYTANPVLAMRKQFDLFFNRRSNNWGGGFPRPSIEGIEGTWASNNPKQDVSVSSIQTIRDSYFQEKFRCATLFRNKNGSSRPGDSTNSYKID